MTQNEFICELNKMQTVEELIEYFINFLKFHGLDRIIFNDSATNSKNRRIDLKMNYPCDWLKRYKEENNTLYDNIYLNVYASKKPFSRSDFMKGNINNKFSIIMDESKEYSLVSGCGIPIHLFSGKIYNLGLIKKDKSIRDDSNSLGLLNDAASHLCAAYMDLQGVLSNKKGIYLTDREREILCLIADGKTKAQTAKELLVSESCVKRHCENIFEKLEVHNLSSAIAMAFRLGLIF